MKLKNLVLAAALSLPMLALADDMSTSNNPFAGMYAGLGLGYTNLSVHRTSGSDDRDYGKGGIAGQVLAGYNFGLNANWLVGLQAYVNANNAQPTVYTNSNHYSMSPIYGADVLLGYAFNQTAMLFGGLGLANSKFKVCDYSSHKQTFNGWTGTLGAQETLTDSFSVRESASYTGFKSKSIVVGEDTFTYKPTAATAMMSLIYTFNI